MNSTERMSVELAALAFQGVLTLLLLLVYYGLWRQRRRPYDLAWAAAWGVYALRLGFISAYIVTRQDAWLFLHQTATGLSALLLLYAALHFSQGPPGGRRYFALAAAVVAWAYVAVFVIRDLIVAGLSSAILLSGVTLWTGIVFWRYRRRVPSAGATILAWSFSLWGLHHLDYPLVRALGTGVLLGVYIDILFIVTTAIGALYLVLGREQRMLELRNQQLEQLTRLLLTAQEEERRRIARELHDEAGQILTAVKIDLDLTGRKESADLVGRAITQMRNLSDLLRPQVLDLGLLPAIRSLAEDFSARGHVRAILSLPESLPGIPPGRQVAIYRIVQEALTNVLRHADASRVHIALDARNDHIALAVEDDGRGPSGELRPHLGLLGMRERVTALGGTLAVGPGSGRGFRIEASIPREADA
ncbi:MAG: sensor histidine kinase [Candidatus Eiseniibacteriota bacterium]